MATIKISQLTERLNYPPSIRAKLSTVHGEMLSWLVDNFKNTARFKLAVLSVFNTISYYYLAGDTLPENWSAKSPLDNIENVDRDLCKNALKDIYLTPQSVEWDLKEFERPITDIKSPAQIMGIPGSVLTVKDPEVASRFRPAEPPAGFHQSKEPEAVPPAYQPNMIMVPTSPKDLYIQPPDVPRFDFKSIWFKGFVGENEFIIYKSLPDVPTTQREISITTSVDRMTDRDLQRLFPNSLIRTRHSSMYDASLGLPMDSDLGTIIPIEGYKPELVKENIIRYPHLFRLYRIVDGKRVSFYNHIEIAGKLIPIHEIWLDLPDSKKIPHTIEFMKEYVVRRYLLERDISLIHHVYPMYGALDEFLTLFAPSDKYLEWGFKNTLDLARRCVQSRVSYKQSRNPILEVCRE